MLVERFSSSGLAAARMDDLRAEGHDVVVSFKPRSLHDPAPFVIEMQQALPTLPQPTPEITEDGPESQEGAI